MTAPLTSVTTVRARMNITTVDASDDDLQFLIDAYSAAIAAYCEREFGPHPEEGLERTFGYTGRGYLSLAPFDLRAVTSVALDTGPGGTPTVLALGEYGLPDPGAQLTYWSLTGLPWRTSRVLATVAGDWGTQEIPADVELACVMAVGDAIRNPEGFSSRSIGELAFAEVDEEPTAGGRNIPPDARAMLGPYRRRVYV